MACCNCCHFSAQSFLYWQKTLSWHCIVLKRKTVKSLTVFLICWWRLALSAVTKGTFYSRAPKLLYIIWNLQTFLTDLYTAFSQLVKEAVIWRECCLQWSNPLMRIGPNQESKVEFCCSLFPVFEKCNQASWKQNVTLLCNYLQRGKKKEVTYLWWGP